MIRTALKFIRDELDSYFVEREQDSVDYAEGSIVDLKSMVPDAGDGGIVEPKHITMMMVGLDEERREGKRAYYVPSEDKQFYRLNPPVELDVFILFASQVADYEKALRDISNLVSFFQSNPVFDGTKYPSLNATVTQPEKKPWQLIERLSFRLHMLTFEQQNNLWGMLGKQYVPSALYKMSLLTVFEIKSKEKVSAITELNFAEN